MHPGDLAVTNHRSTHLDGPPLCDQWMLSTIRPHTAKKTSDQDRAIVALVSDSNIFLLLQGSWLTVSRSKEVASLGSRRVCRQNSSPCPVALLTARHPSCSFHRTEMNPERTLCPWVAMKDRSHRAAHTFIATQSTSRASTCLLPPSPLN